MLQIKEYFIIHAAPKNIQLVEGGGRGVAPPKNRVWWCSELFSWNPISAKIFDSSATLQLLQIGPNPKLDASFQTWSSPF